MSCCRIHTHEKTCYPSDRRKNAGVTHSIISNAHSTEKKIVKRTYVCNCCGPHCAKTLKWVKNLCNSLEFATMIRKDKAFRIQFYQSGTLLISSLVAASQSACQKKCCFFFFSQAVNEAEDTVIQYFWTRLVFINYDPAPSACLLLLCEVQSLAIGVTESRDFLDPRRKKRHKKGSPRVLRQHGWEQGLNQRRRRRRRGRRRREERGGVTRFTYRLSPFFFYLKASWKTESPFRQGNTWWTLSDGTIWREPGFDSSHKTDWLHPLSTWSTWQKHTTANQSSQESSWVWALLIILFSPRARNQFVSFSIPPSFSYHSGRMARGTVWEVVMKTISSKNQWGLDSALKNAERVIPALLLL